MSHLTRWSLTLVCLAAAGCNPGVNGPIKVSASSDARREKATPQPSKPAAVESPSGFATPAATTSAAPASSAPASAAPVGPSPSAQPNRPLTYYGTLFDHDGVANWVPGEVVEGPLHVNRGPASRQRPPVGEKHVGRSRFTVWIAGRTGNPFPNRPGLTHPVFQGPVSLGYDADGDRSPTDPDVWTPFPNNVSGHWLGGNMGDKQFLKTTTQAGEVLPAPESEPVRFEGTANVFPHPANATALAGRPGPILTADVPLPQPLAGRLGEVLGLPPGTRPDQPWLAALPDGVYVPTTALTTRAATGYTAADRPTGGIYVRGTVEVLRGAVRGTASFLMFQVGYPGGPHHRTYVLRIDRQAGSLTLTALPSGRLLADTLEAVKGDVEHLAATPGVAATDLAAWGLAGPGTLSQRFSAPPGSPPFNGLVAVDYGASDPLRNPERPGELLPATATRRPLTGHILALGAPDFGPKRALGGAADALPPELRAAEVFSTAPAGQGEPTGLTIAAVGHVFIQNHLIVEGLAGAGGSPPTLAGLDKALHATTFRPEVSRDRLAVWADRRIFVGLAAPSAPARGDVGVLLTASLIGLEDPARTAALLAGKGHPDPDAPVQSHYLGSLCTEGIASSFALSEEAEVGTGEGGRTAAAGKPEVAVLNPLYRESVDGNAINFAPRGRLVIFGSRLQAKRGIVGTGNYSFDKDFRYDPRLAELPPPLLR